MTEHSEATQKRYAVSEYHEGTSIQDPPFLTSLGGVWLDELQWSDKPSRQDVVGGSATYAILGARLFSTSNPGSLLLIINAGDDFPSEVVRELRTWQVRILIIQHTGKPSTRGILDHTMADGVSVFTRLTPPLLTPLCASIPQVDNAMQTEVLHVFADAYIARQRLHEVHHLRQAGQSSSKQTVIWEPHPKSCTAKHLEDHLVLLRSGLVTVFSPNHHELAGFMGSKYDYGLPVRDAVTSLAEQFCNELKRGTMQAMPVVIIRAAEHGCLIRLPSESPCWLPAYFQRNDQDKVIDPTGAGNAFLGGLAQGWRESDSWVEAACYANVAASVIVQHIGPPIVQHNGDMELWSGLDVRQRLTEYKLRLEVQRVLQSEDNA